jgi:hypothetical protein
MCDLQIEPTQISENLRFHIFAPRSPSSTLLRPQHRGAQVPHGSRSIRTTSDTCGHAFKAVKAALADPLEATFQTSQKAATAELLPNNQTAGPGELFVRAL